MKKCLIAVAMIASLALPASAQLTSQQQRMKDCNTQSSGMTGDARKQFMSSCLSGAGSETKGPDCTKGKPCGARLVDAGPLQAAWSWPKQTTRSPVKSSSANVSPNRLSYGCPARIFRDILAALFWPAPSGHRGRENRRVTDAVHDRIGTRARSRPHRSNRPSRFQAEGSEFFR